MAPNDFDSSASGKQDEAYLTPAVNPFSSVHPLGTGMFPKLTPRKFPDDEDAAPEQVPVMEQVPTPGAGFPAPTYGPPPSYSSQDFPAERAPADYSAATPCEARQYGTPRAAGMAPPLPVSGQP